MERGGIRMENVLLLSGSLKGQESLAQLLKANGFITAAICENSGEARRTLIQNDFALVVINTPLSDEFGHEFALTVAQTTSAGVVMLVKNELADDISAKVEDYGVLVIAKPLNRLLFSQTIKLAAASRRRFLSLQTENIKLQNKIEEIRLVNRAKCALIQYLGLTEAQAHRYIEKQAMDMRQTRRETARSILSMYEN